MILCLSVISHVFLNTLRPRQNGHHFADDIFKYIFLNENVWIPITISLKFVAKGLVDNIPALVQIMAWRRAGDKPLSEPMIFSLPTHICVTRPQWVNHIMSFKMWHLWPMRVLRASHSNERLTHIHAMIIGNVTCHHTINERLTHTCCDNR